MVLREPNTRKAPGSPYRAISLQRYPPQRQSRLRPLYPPSHKVLRAIERATHFVLILPRRALVSDWIKREWLHARMVGKKVSPVLADPAIKRSDLLPWIRREEVYEIAEPERWRQACPSPGRTRRNQARPVYARRST